MEEGEVRKLHCLWIGICVTVLAGQFESVYGLQSFRERPVNVSSIRGQTTIFRCAIDDLAGRIQWSKDGILLGFDRSIPGYARYRVVGDESRGEYNLMIENVSLSDDGEFQCQVMPTGDHPSLQASAYLTVLVPPEQPVIAGYSNGSVIEVPYTRNLLEVMCVAKNGRPAATIQWLKNGRIVTDGLERWTEPVVGDKRITSKCNMTMRPDISENKSNFTCTATNSAIQGEPMRTTFLLSVQYPPGRPEITGYTNGDIIKTGHTLRLVCTSRGGNPLGEVVWFKNDVRMDFSYTSGNNLAQNDLTFDVESSDNNAFYRCEVTNVATVEPLTAQFRLTVHFAPAAVNITGQLLAKAGETVTLFCESDISNPAAVITWFAKGRQLPRISSTVTASPDGGFITKSNVTVTLTDQENNVIYTCQATNEALGQTVAGAVTLSVLYPPQKPIISGYSAGMSIRAGTVKRLTCMAVGGNPVAVLKWFKGSKKLSSTNKVTGSISSSEISILTEPSDNQAEYICKASNKATTRPIVTKIKLTVHFPPKKVTISSLPLHPIADNNMTLTCLSASSNPAAVITWIKDGRRMQGITESEQDADHGGKTTRNILKFTPTYMENGAVYGCRATNEFLEQSVNDAITLDVLFAPVFDPAVHPSILSIVEKKSKAFNFTVFANPPDVMYSLYRNGVKLKLPRVLRNFALSNGILNITKVVKSNKGDYVLKANNTQGLSEYNITVDVQYATVIKSITSPVKADKGGTAHFECVADANPQIDNMVRWSREDYDMTKTKQRYENGKSFLTVLQLEKTDRGKFKCTASNGIGKPVSKEAMLIVKYAPEINKAPQYAKSASDKGAVGKLLCIADAEPTVTFKWFKDGDQLTMSSSKLSVATKKKVTVYENTLSVKNISKADYGTYKCKATNAMGEDTLDILLDGTSMPDTPYDVKFINATHNSITISWMAGFNGGLEQMFQVRYRPQNAKGYIHIDIPSSETRVYTIKGLKLGTSYELTVRASNVKGHSSYQAKFLTAKTSTVAPSEVSSNPSLPSTDEVPVIIILVVCIVGIFLLALNVGLILFFVRRKKMQNGSDTTSQTNTFELYGPSKETPLYQFSPSEDGRSYDTFDKNVDDYSEDKSYEDDDIKRVFLPPPDYASRTQTPSKLDSPRTGSHKTFLTDGGDTTERKTSYKQEDPYRTSGSRKMGTFENSENNVHYADQLREISRSGNLYDPNGRLMGRQESRPKSTGDGINDRAAGRPSSRTGKTPPPPPVRSSSRGAAESIQGLPPLPARNYGPQDLPPRYGPTPGSSLSPTAILNPNYEGPPAPKTPSPRSQHTSNEMRGHLV